jgi:hypothetical protein
MKMTTCLYGIMATLFCLLATPGWAADLSVQQAPGDLRFLAGDTVIARYVYQDEEIHRPYFCDIRTLDGIQVTRNNPPVEGQDPTDHGEYHPGAWLAFGDLSGADNWRNKAPVLHARFVEKPLADAEGFRFAVENTYHSNDGKETVCREVARYRLVVRADKGWFLISDSTFSSEKADFYFGDQEEMGFGIRVATPMMVGNGGEIISSGGLRNEDEVWGKTAAWCDYRGVVQGKKVGVCILPHPENVHASWFHARDYGLLLANPFGRNAFTGGEKSKVVVPKGEALRLRFGLWMHGDEKSPPAVYRDFLSVTSE